MDRGGVSKRAETRQLKIDLAQALGRDCNASFDETDLMDTMRSIYIPLRAELADTYNRHYWLHKTELRLSSVRFLEVDQDDLMTECDEGISVGAVSKFTNFWMELLIPIADRFRGDDR
ncbi:hypothetical protein V1525DRAFT_430760 [Lipomyces kononenkoae]|uniref:Uncharacterized protein n=1 Tax=Lipomyces kononenkoae TaxID=34357 RepID=A0ACC3T7K5_LIPKO